MKAQKVVAKLENQAQAHLVQYMVYNLAVVETPTPQQKRVLSIHKNRFSYLDKLATDKASLLVS